MAVDRQDVLDCFRFLLRREPDSEEEIQSYMVNDSTFVALIKKVFTSPEFYLYQNRGELPYDFNCEGMDIKQVSYHQRNSLFEETAKVWEKFGDKDPFWSVLSLDNYRINNIDNDTLEQFYASGKQEVETIIATLRRNQFIRTCDDAKNLDIVEVGCGVGRVTYWMQKTFKHVLGVDISLGNINIAKKKVNDAEFLLCKNVKDYQKIGKTDVVYSVIVLQHNTPPVIEYVISAMLDALRPNGMAMFQVPTYRQGYAFNYEDYISDAGKRMEMHVLSEKRIFEIADEHHCVPVEVYEYRATGLDDKSMMFMMSGSKPNYKRA